MEFNVLIITKLFPILQKYGFEVVDEFNNYVKFESDNLVVVICRDVRENSNLFSLGRRGSNRFFIDGNIMKKFFNFDFEKVFILPERSIKDFTDNMLVFFKQKGEVLFNEKCEILLDIENSAKQQSKKYTSILLMEQTMDVASRAWEAKDYLAFIDSIDKIGVNILPISYQLKYKLAKEKFIKNK
jgi:hypothetical protein